MRTIPLAAGIAAFAMLAGTALAQSYPVKPIRFILPYAGGGSADALARSIGEEVHERLGQPMLVESHPGANSMIGAELVARSAPDGYTVLYLGWPTITTNFVMYKKVPYKLQDFQPITTFFRTPVGLTVKSDMPVSNLKELIEYARKQGSLAYGTSGAGSSPHLLMEKLSKVTGVRFEHVPYKGEGPAVQDVLGGHLPMFAGSLATPAQFLKAGTLKVIVTSNAERLPEFPNVPTFKEAGFASHVFTYWHGAAVPAGTPQAVVDKLHAAFVAAMASARVRKVLTPDQIPTTLSPKEFSELIRRDIENWGPVVREANLVE